MPTTSLKARLRAFAHAWPWPGAILLLAAFLVTFLWFLTLFLEDAASYRADWFEPLAAIVGGLGAFLVAAVLIFRRIETAEIEAGDYRLARGLATAYYFNFVRLVVGALRDPAHPLHAAAAQEKVTRIAGLVVAVPESWAEFDPEAHEKLLATRFGPFEEEAPAAAHSTGSEPEFTLKKLLVRFPDRPRPVLVTLARHTDTGIGVLLDIPTVLVAIADFAQFIADTRSAADSSDERIAEARREIVASSEAEQFGEILREFESVIAQASIGESPERSPATLLHVVPLKRLRRRADELVAS
ncbi:MAG: STING domain-containing protein [Reyranellaceae bacterium]